MADHLVTYKCPSTYEFVDEPVRDEAGKVRRSLLAEERQRHLSVTVADLTRRPSGHTNVTVR